MYISDLSLQYDSYWLWCFKIRENKKVLFLKRIFFRPESLNMPKYGACCPNFSVKVLVKMQRYTYGVLQTIQMKLILFCVWAEQAVLGSAKTALKFKYEIEIG